MEELLNVLDENGVTVLVQVFESEIPEKYADFDTEYTKETRTSDGTIIDIYDAVWCEDTEEIYHIEEAYYCELTKQYYSTDTEFIEYNGDTMVHESARDSHDLVHCYYYEYYIDRDNALWCTDVDDYVHEDYATYCEADGEYYYDEDNMPSSYGKEHISEYHSSPEADDLNQGKSPYSVGFEIEKTDFQGAEDVGEEIGYYEIFKGFETDSSCGVEAITNILPLSTDNEVANKVFEMMREAESVLDSDTDISCGGHITISAKGYNSSELYDKIRSSMALIYSLWRFRLKNEYCKKNGKLKKENNDKYSPLNLKSNGCIEIRLPNRVQNVEQLQLRYKLIAVIVEHCLTTNHTFNTLLKKCTPILNEMYNNDNNKLRLIKSLSRSFWNYLVTETASEDIKKFLPEYDN